MKRLLTRLALVALTLVILVAATGCSKNGNLRWRRSAGWEYELFVVVPVSNPYRVDNQAPEFIAAMQNAAFQWDASPDISVELVVVGQRPDFDPNQDFCKTQHSDPNTDFNCVEAWYVPQSHMDSDHNGAVGIAITWGSQFHLLNGPAENPSRIEISDVFTGNEPPEHGLVNAACHELGHSWGLKHADMLDLDNNPNTGVNGLEYQPPGPCQAGVPDRDEDAPYDLLGFDWQNIDALYDNCVWDSTGPRGSLWRNFHGFDNLDTIGYDECGFSASAQSGQVTDIDDYEGLTLHEERDYYEDFVG